jgi:ATP-dependent DNA helicase RecQ
MRLRTAKKGKNAGGQFYGCAKYPHCKGAVNASGGEGGSESAVSRIGTSRPMDSVREMVVAPRHAGWQARVFQSVSLPSSLVRAVHENDVSRAIVRNFAHWRLDYPLPKTIGSSIAIQSVIAVIESLLSRGAISICSRRLESLLKYPVGATSSDGIRDALLGSSLSPTIRFEQIEFDSREEQLFAEWASVSADFRGHGWSLTAQVHLRSLAFPIETTGSERVDFAFAHPTGGIVIVEIDGEAHEQHRAADNARDVALAAVGIDVLRVPTLEVVQGRGPKLDLVQARLRAESEVVLDAELAGFRLAKFAHQVQCSVLEALRGGWLTIDTEWTVAVRIPEALAGTDKSLAIEVVNIAITELRELIDRVWSLHELPTQVGGVSIQIVSGTQVDAAVLIAPATREGDRLESKPGTGRFLISDGVLGVEVAAPMAACRPLRLHHPNREHVEWFLDYVFRKQSFWEGQWETIERLLQGKDTVVLLPTGGGKSICYQLTALLLPGRCIVVAPILSLIDDQIDNLGRVGIDRCAGITSQITDSAAKERITQAFASGQYLFCYVAPERFQTEPFRDSLRTLTTSLPVSLVVVDEAHCVSEWGHDFRTAYLNLGRVAREYCASDGLVPPLVALTGTASRIVLKDIQRELGIPDYDALITPTTFDRPELEFIVHRSKSDEKNRRVEGILNGLPTTFGIDRSTFFRARGGDSHAGLVFCPYVNGDYGVVRQAEELQHVVGSSVQFYSGGAPRGYNKSEWNDTKRTVAKNFKRNATTILACTKAFGMGIDKPNIRFTIHTGLPDSIESFYQEAGRAGRDRGRARCSIVVSNDDAARTAKLLDPKTDIAAIARIVEETPRDDADDIVRALWFHVQSFRGTEAEMADAGEVIKRIGSLQSQRKVSITWRGYVKDDDDASHQRLEKALHRLVVLGAVSDYTVNYGSREFGVRVSGTSRDQVAESVAQFIGAYQRGLANPYRLRVLEARGGSHQEFLARALAVLIEFVYETIERARRRSLLEMLNASSQGDGEALRQRILSYLQTSEFDEALESLINQSQVGGLDRLSPSLDTVGTPTEASALRGAVGRYLTSYPDVPGLLLLRAVAESLSKDCNVEAVRQSTGAALTFALGKYGVSAPVTAAALSSAASCAAQKTGMALVIVDAAVRSSVMNRDTARELARTLSVNLAGPPIRWLASRVSQQAHDLILSGRNLHG